MYAEVEVVRVTVGHEEVAPVLQHVACVLQRERQLEEVVWPAQLLAPSEREAEQLHVLVGVVEVLVVVVAVIVAVAVHIVIVVVEVTTIIVVARHVGLLREVGAYGELYRSFASEPVGRVRHVVRLVVCTVGLCADREHLAVAYG